MRSHGGIMGFGKFAIAAVVALSIGQPAFAGGDYFDNYLKLQRLQRDEARGGPFIEGGRSPFQRRYKVCNVMPTPARDPASGQRILVQRKVCWYE